MCTDDTKLIIVNVSNCSVSFRKLWGVCISFLFPLKIQSASSTPRSHNTMRCLLALLDFFVNPLLTRFDTYCRVRVGNERGLWDVRKTKKMLGKKIEISIYFNYLISDRNEFYCLLSIVRFIHHLFSSCFMLSHIETVWFVRSRLLRRKAGEEFVGKSIFG